MQKPTKTDKRRQKTFILATQIGYIFQSATRKWVKNKIGYTEKSVLLRKKKQ